MKTLYIIRHAKSSWDDPYLADFDRPLNGRGKRNVPDMGERLAALGIKPDLLLSSPAKRAITTARGIAEAIGYDPALIRQDMGLYHASSANIKGIISETNDDVETLMVFGHNPGFTSLIGALSDFHPFNLPTCGVCGIRFQFKSWKDLLATKGEKIYYDYPKSRS